MTVPASRVVLPRLYAILDVDLVQSRGLIPDDVCDVWLSAGVRLIQLRAKSLASGPFLDLADRLAARAREAGATFLLNDRVDLAKLSGAAGVHVGQTDLTPVEARAILGPLTMVGLSTHSHDELTAALVEPIDYVAVGAIFPTSTKPSGPGAPPVVGLRFLRAAAAAAGSRPVVAIGGITSDTAAQVIEAGASAVAVISDLLVGDVESRVRQFLHVLS